MKKTYTSLLFVGPNEFVFSNFLGCIQVTTDVGAHGEGNNVVFVLT